MAIARDGALMVVDVQKCFLPGGSLGVPGGDAVIPRLNAYIARFRRAGRPIFASRDWHPQETVHFQKWPPHCVQNTEGAEFGPGLELPEDAVVVSKGMDPDQDAYSAFQALDDGGRLLPQLLEERGIGHLYVGGLALDYCVRFTSEDAIGAGMDVTVLIDATRAVNADPHDAEEAIEELVRRGVHLATLETIGD